MNIEHIERLNSIAKLEKESFTGSDVSLDTSLFEYGLAWLEMETETLFIYGIGHDGSEYNTFDRCTFSNDMDVQSEFGWAVLGGVCNMCGMDLQEWLAMPLPSKIGDLVQYYGFENVFGSSYWEGFKIGE
jgi:hypothetical protein